MKLLKNKEKVMYSFKLSYNRLYREIKKAFIVGGLSYSVAACAEIPKNTIVTIENDVQIQAHSPFLQTFASTDALKTVKARNAASISLDKKHVLWDGQSLRWQWQAGDVLELNHPYKLDFRVRPDGVVYTPVFGLNVYNEAAISDEIKIEVGEASFTFGLNFTGWRSAAVRYYNDMQGKVSEQGTGYKIIAPKTGSGTIWLDGVIPNGNAYEAVLQADFQVPYVADGFDEHMKKGPFRSRLITTKLEPKIEATTEEQLAAAKLIEQRIEENLLKIKVKQPKKVIAKATQILNGPPMLSRRNLSHIPKPLPPTTTPAKVFDLLEDIAVLYRTKGDSIYRDTYLKLLQHSWDQGWVLGSSHSNLHLAGYAGSKSRTQANFLMREVLREEGILEQVVENMQWYVNARECLILPVNRGDLDYMHTYMIPQLLVHLLENNEAKRIAWLKAYQTYVNQVIGFDSNDAKDGFKDDGSAFHHSAHYPGYAAGAVYRVAQLRHLLIDTPFALNEQSVDRVRKSLGVMLSSTIGDDFPVSLSGRHPFKLNNKWTKELKDSVDLLGGITVKDKQYLSVDNAAMATHRRPDWFVVMHSFSKYVWPYEVFAGAANRYGALMNHGSVEIMLGNSLADSGLASNGWDWRMYPGATTIKAPYPVLKDFIIPELYSREAFTGSLTLDGVNGQFSTRMTNDFFALSARKSVFSFDNVLVLLGNDIHSSRQNYETITTLFQNTLEKTKNKKTIEIDNIEGLYRIKDAVGNSYLLADKAQLKVTKGIQHSYTPYKAEPVSGEYYTAWLDHGLRPENESYAYTILVQASDNEVKQYAKSPRIQVIEQSNIAHIIKDAVTGITALSLFEPGKVNDKVVNYVSKPSMLQYRETAKGIEIAVSDPDLQWGQKRFDEVRIVLNGAWKIPEQAGVTLSQLANSQTSIVLATEPNKPVKFYAVAVK